MLIHIIGVLPSLSDVLLYVLDAQLFLLPLRIPHRERNSSDKQGVACSPQGRDFLCYAVYIGRHVLNQPHFDIACKYLSLFMEPPYRSNKTGYYRLVQITWYSDANESFQKLFWPTIDFKNDCIRHTPPSLCSYSYFWIYFCGEIMCSSSWVHNGLFLSLCIFSANRVQWEYCGGFKLYTDVLVKTRRSGLTDWGLTYPHVIKTFWGLV